MRTLESMGKSVDEAIFNGLKELQISIDEVEIEILQQETKGVFGIGAKPAIVKLIEREPEEIVIPDYVLNKDQPRERREGGRGDDRGRGGRRNGPRYDREERPSSGPRDGYNSRRGERAGREDRFQPPAKPSIDYSAEAAVDNPSAQFLQGLLTHMGIEANVLANLDEEGSVRLYIDAETMGVLIGRRGETLDAIQYISSLALNRNRKEQGYTRLTIDTEGYRDKREQTLTRLAQKVASQVRTSGRAVTLEPMNPYERRVLHATLQTHPYVATHSEGEEPNRRVVIEPKRD